MTAPSSIDPARFLHGQLESASPDLLRSMLTTFINTLMSAEADAVCGAPYGMPGPDRVNVRDGYRHRALGRATPPPARRPTPPARASTPPATASATTNSTAKAPSPFATTDACTTSRSAPLPRPARHPAHHRPRHPDPRPRRSATPQTHPRPRQGLPAPQLTTPHPPPPSTSQGRAYFPASPRLPQPPARRHSQGGAPRKKTARAASCGGTTLTAPSTG